jgi:hypothetical protein
MTASTHCARPGCGGGVAAWLTYDYRERTAWLDDAETSSEGDRWALCSGHTEGFRVPRGWTCRDRRRGPRAATGPARLVAPERAAEVAMAAEPAEAALAPVVSGGPEAPPPQRAVAV